MQCKDVPFKDGAHCFMHMFLQWCTSLMLIPADALTSYCKLHAGLFSLNTCRAILSSRGSAHVYLPSREETIHSFFFLPFFLSKLYNNLSPFFPKQTKTNLRSNFYKSFNNFLLLLETKRVALVLRNGRGTLRSCGSSGARASNYTGRIHRSTSTDRSTNT